MSTKKRNIIIAAISVVLVAIVFIVIFAMQSNARVDEPQSEPSSELVSSEPVSSEITVPPIKAPAASSKPVSSKETSSETVIPPVVDVTASVDTSSEDAASTWNETAFEKTMYTNQSCSSRKQPIKGAAVVAKLAINTEVKITAKTDTEYYKLADGAFVHQSFLSEQKTEVVSATEKPQANESYTKPANRNMPSFTVDNSVTGPQGYHGQTDGEFYYHAGCDEWMSPEFWFVFRYGLHPEATTYIKRSPQVSPYQQDGDYNPFQHGGDYFCAACKGWVYHEGWENGKHGSGKNHLANVKKMNG